MSPGHGDGRALQKRCMRCGLALSCLRPTVSATSGRVRRRRDREQPPLAGDALELGDAAVLEVQVRAGDEILDRGGDEHLAGPGERGDASTDVDGEPGDLVACELALAGVQPGSHLEAELGDGGPDRRGAADGADRPVEAGEEAVAGRIHLNPAEARKLPADGSVVLVQKLAPAAVAKLRHHLGRADDVREQYGRQHPIGLELFPLSGSDLGAEPLDLGEERVRVADCRGEVAAGKLDKPGAGNLLGEVSSAANVEPRQLRAMQDERRYPDRPEHAADVDVEVHTHVIAHGAGAHAQAKGARERHPLVLGHIGITHRKHPSLVPIPPRTDHLLDVLLLLAAGGKPRELGRAHQARRGVDQHEPFRALRIGGGEEHCERTALAESANDGPLRTGGVHHRPDVVHARLQRRIARDAVGHARAALVEYD
jgi:hypothetical protein